MTKIREQSRMRVAARAAESSPNSLASSRGWLSSVAFRYAPGSWGSATRFHRRHRDSLLLDQVQDLPLLLQHLALLLEHLELLDVDGMQRRQGDVIGLGAGVLAGRDHVLADDDDGQEHELEEGLADQYAQCGQERVVGYDRHGPANRD